MTTQTLAPTYITHLRFVGLRVTDLATQREFYRDTWGLKETETDTGLVHLAGALSDDQYVMRLRQDENEGLDVLSFAVAEPEHVDAYVDPLMAVGAQIISKPGELPSAGGGYGMRFFDPEGRTLEIATAPQTGSLEDLAERDWRPGKLSHIVLNSPNMEGLTRWYGDVLGLPIADRLADVMIFLRCASPWHHLIAIATNDYTSVNHVAFETRGIDEYMRASGRLLRGGIPCVWGPGRHGPGDNTFAYFQDQAGFVVEYTTALEEVPDWTTWKPRVHPINPEWSDQWGTACTRDPAPFRGIPERGLFVAPPC